MSAGGFEFLIRQLPISAELPKLLEREAVCFRFGLRGVSQSHRDEKPYYGDDQQSGDWNPKVGLRENQRAVHACTLTLVGKLLA